MKLERTLGRLLGAVITTALLFSISATPARAATATLAPVRRLGFGSLQCSALSPDGSTILTGGAYGAFLIDIQTGAVTQEFLGHTMKVMGVAFSRDGKRILTGSQDNSARLWDTQTGACLHTFNVSADDVNAVALSPDGRRALTGYQDGTTRLWDTASGANVLTLKGHTAAVLAVAFSPDGTEVLTGSADYSAMLWNAANGAWIRNYNGHLNSINSVAFSPDGKKLLTGSADRTALAWDKATGKQLLYFYGHTSGVNAASFSPDGKRVMTASNDKTMRLWDAASGSPIRTFTGHTSPVNCAAFNAVGDRVLSSSYQDQTVRLWDAATTQSIAVYYNHSARVTAVALSPNGGMALTGGDDQILRLWDTSNGQLIRAYPGQPSRIFLVDFLKNQTQVFAAGITSQLITWDLAHGSVASNVAMVRAFTNPFGMLSPDQKTLLVNEPGSDPKLIDMATGKTIFTISTGSSVSAMAYNADGSKALLGCSDSLARLWSLTDNKLLFTYAGHATKVDCVGFLDNDAKILTKDGSGGSRIWETATGKPLKTFAKLPSTTPMAFSPDCTRLVSNWRIYDMGSGTLLQTMSYPNLSNNAVNFSRDGKYIITGDYGGAAFLWANPATNAAGPGWALYP